MCRLYSYIGITCIFVEMGIVMSNNDDPENKVRKQLSKRIDDELLMDKKKQAEIIKLLLLGNFLG